MVSWKPIPILLFLLFAVHSAALASNMEEGSPTAGEVLTVSQGLSKSSPRTLRVKLLDGCRGPSGWTSKGVIVQITVSDKKTPYTPGQKVKVCWMKYSAMGANGPVSGTSWKIVP